MPELVDYIGLEGGFNETALEVEDFDVVQKFENVPTFYKTKAPLEGNSLAARSPDFYEECDYDDPDALLVGSRIKKEPDNWHILALDIDDRMVKVYPSSRPNHYHLYIDHPMSWDEYQQVIKVLEKVELLEPGYVKASLARGQTYLRLPWKKKRDARP